MNEPTVARFQARETSLRRTVMVARVAADIPAGAFVGLVDVGGQLFLRVFENDAPAFLSATELTERWKSK